MSSDGQKKERGELTSLGLSLLVLLGAWLAVSIPVAEMQYPLELSLKEPGLKMGAGFLLAIGIFWARHRRHLGLGVMLSVFSVAFACGLGFLWNLIYSFVIVGVG